MKINLGGRPGFPVPVRALKCLENADRSTPDEPDGERLLPRRRLVCHGDSKTSIGAIVMKQLLSRTRSCARNNNNNRIILRLPNTIAALKGMLELELTDRSASGKEHQNTMGLVAGLLSISCCPWHSASTQGSGARKTELRIGFVWVLEVLTWSPSLSHTN